jgi:predicted nucleotidyltransferase component of viral defense system
MEYGPVKISYPSMLDFEPPMILAYSLESAIAEKLQAIVSLGLFGSRMKDFYDIWFLLNNRDLDKERLRKAIESTFKNRNTDIDNINLIFKNEFIHDVTKATQWTAFLKRIKLNQDVSFESIMLDLKRFFRNEVNLIS